MAATSEQVAVSTVDSFGSSSESTMSPPSSPHRRKRRNRARNKGGVNRGTHRGNGKSSNHSHSQQHNGDEGTVNKSVLDCSDSIDSISISTNEDRIPSSLSSANNNQLSLPKSQGATSSSSNSNSSNHSAWGREALQFDEALEKVLGPSKNDSPMNNDTKDSDDDALRQFAVDHLEKLLAKWTPQNQASNPWSRTRPTLITFGSYRLGVHRKDSDLDVLALCPPEFSRAAFFSSWVELLKEDRFISKVHPIPGAYTPVIKFTFRNSIPVDMLFARVADGSKLQRFQQTRVSPLVGNATTSSMGPTGRSNNHQNDSSLAATARTEYSIDDSDLKEQDEAGVRSLNGARVSQMLLEMVPDLPRFRKLLRAVKEWAVAKGIYSNVLGFMGGVNYAILAAWICRQYPNEEPHTLLKHFFRVFSEWQWPYPLMLLPIQSQPPEGAPTMPAWDPQTYPRDRLHIMPIITPAYPSMNSTYNVGIPQKRRIQEEFRRASITLNASLPLLPNSILSGTHPRISGSGNNSSTQVHGDSRNPYATLLEPSDFFARHANFLQITIRAMDEQDFLEWFRLVESRLRLLIASLETTDMHVWPYSHFFERAYDVDGNLMYNDRWGRSESSCLHESLLFIGLRFAKGVEDIDLAPLTSDFLYKVNSWEGRKLGMDLSINHLLADQLPFPCRPAKMITAKEEAELYSISKENLGANRQHYANHPHGYNNGGGLSKSFPKGQGTFPPHPQRRHGKNTNQNRRSRSNTANNNNSNNGANDRNQSRPPNRNDGRRTVPRHVGNSGTTDPHSATSSIASERAVETEETQSMASDISLATQSDAGSLDNSNRGGSVNSHSRTSPLKRICVYATRTPEEDTHPTLDQDDFPALGSSNSSSSVQNSNYAATQED